jgi:hypothetical protein
MLGMTEGAGGLIGFPGLSLRVGSLGYPGCEEGVWGGVIYILKRLLFHDLGIFREREDDDGVH